MYNTPEQQPTTQPPPPPYFQLPKPAPSYPPAAAVAPPQPQSAVDPRARAAGIALLVAAGLLLLAALTKSWFVAGNEGGVGLLGLEKCRRGICQSISWFDFSRVPTQIPIFATTALIASLGAIVVLFHSGAMLYQGAAHRVKLAWLVQLLVLALFGAVAFVFSLSIGDWSRGLSVGWSTFAGLAALVGASIVTAAIVRPLSARSMH